MSLESFIGLLGECGIDVVDYPTDELDSDLENALAGLKRLSLWAQQQVVDCIEFMKARYQKPSKSRVESFDCQSEVGLDILLL